MGRRHRHGAWNQIRLPDGDYEFQSTGNPSLYLTGAAAGAALTLQSGTTNGSQEWRLVPVGGGTITGTARTPTNANTGTCLDDYHGNTANGASVDLWPCTGGANQNWSLIPAGGSTYVLVNQYSGLCIDDPYFNKASGVLADLWTCNGGTNQQWALS